MKYITATQGTLYEVRLPKNIEAFAHKSIPHPIVYNRYQKKAFCFACGEYFYYAVPGQPLPEARTVYTMEPFKARDFIICPLCGHRGEAVPHASRKDLAHATLLTGRNEGQTLQLAFLSAYYVYEKDQFEHLKQKTGILYLEELVMLSHEKQSAWLDYGDHLVRLDTVYVHHAIDETNPYIHPSVRTAVSRSCLKFCGVNFPDSRDYSVNCTVKRLALNAKHPQMEYLKKAGLGSLEDSMVWSHPTYLRPNWRRKDLPGLLGLTSQDVDKLRQWKMFDIDYIAAYKEIKRFHPRITKQNMETFFAFFQDIGPFAVRSKYDITFFGLDPVRTAKYLARLYENNRPQCVHGAHGYNKYAVVREYKDYLQQLLELGYPDYDYYLYPKDFFAAHDRVSAEYRQRQEEAARKREAEEVKKKAKQQAAFEEKYLPKLKSLTFSDGTLLIRPLGNLEDFQKEGRNNINCVASYYDRVCQGKTAVFVIRRCDMPDESLATVELRNGEITQCRIRGNKEAPEDVKAFANHWLEEIVKKGKKAA